MPAFSWVVGRALFGCLALVTVALEPDDARVVPLRQAHAHNDYQHDRPLLDALDHGFCSIEADVFLSEGKLLVGHWFLDLRPDRTLEQLYLSPLREHVQKNGGRVYAGGPSIYLLIDVKTDPGRTYAALCKVLSDYADILSVTRGGKFKPNAVTVVISGNCPREVIAAEKTRYAAIDGRLADLDSTAPAELVPWISADWRSVFRWRGAGRMPEAERSRLRELARKAHAAGRLLRFWAAPDNVRGWSEQYDAGVGLINTDRLAGLRRFLLEKEGGP